MSIQINYKGIILQSAKAIIIAIGINIVIFYLATALNFINPDFSMQSNGNKLTVWNVMSSTLLFSFPGVLIFVLLVKLTQRPEKTFKWVCIIGFIIFLPAPFVAFEGIPLSMALSLEIMHVAPAYLLWKYLTSTNFKTKIK